MIPLGGSKTCLGGCPAGVREATPDRAQTPSVWQRLGHHAVQHRWPLSRSRKHGRQRRSP
nr:MAG TPA: hypothetical protein [Caudoviricetes sp.]